MGNPVSGQRYLLGMLCAAAGALCWSLGGMLVRLTSHIDGWQIIFFRSLTVLACMAVWLGVQYGRALPRVFHRAGANAVIAGIAIGAAGLSFIISLFYTTVAQAIFMTGLAPFLSAIMGYWILRERISGITWIAMAIALAGLAVMLIGAGSGGSLPGTLLAVYSAFCFSCYAVLLRWGKDCDMNTALAWNALFLILATGIVLAADTPLRDAGALGRFSVGWMNAGIIVLMGAVQITLGLALFTLGSRAVPAAQLSLVALIEPIVSPLWVWLVASELPPVWTFIGGGVIVFAIALQAIFAARMRLS